MRWARTPMPREQAVLFATRLDEVIGEDHPVRLLDELLRQQDWSAWIKPATDHRGQPPIHPRVLAGILLYGMMRRIRSSRMLEYMARHNLDFIWLAEGHRPDHSTLAGFRKESAAGLKSLFRQIGRLSMAMGLVQLAEVAFDGTRVKANASRYHTWTAAKIEAALQELDALAERMLAEAEAAESQVEETWFPVEASRLPQELATIKQREAKLREVLAALHAQDEARREQGKDPAKSPAQRPQADPDATIMPNKEGGYAANYTPTAAVDVASGMIVDCEVIAAANEHTETLPTVDRIEANSGQKPGAFLADAAHGTGANLEGMARREVAFYTPVESPEPTAENPARRDDPSQPIAAADHAKLPRNRQGQLAKSCFVYDAAADCYFCPQGRQLPYRGIQKDVRNGESLEVRVYRCRDCSGCPLSDACRSRKSRRGRMIYRDPYEARRAETAARMHSAAGRAVYARRMHAAETPFAHIKAVLGVRQFLTRGLANVRNEWRWVCTAYNLKKLLAALAALRASGAAVASPAAR